ncbi:MAG: UDP-N-acetylmuramoyl-L-alanine--D-glutamate ligase [Candidatus Makaraimicrobium thalassicum]|nr:MAG: UDP-N-acetylmuramoyl-L-alanine--D-glutamate ligase [Candidatus Omnitrophota bacterium]
MFDVRGKKVLVVGLGVSGYAAAELLGRRGAAVKITESSDTIEIRERLEELCQYSVEFELGGHTEGFCGDAALVVTSPGIDNGSLPLAVAGNRGIPVIGELELGFLFCRAPIIAITGTNGKSTTTELIGRILSLSGRHTALCGNIGNPLSGEVDFLTGESVAVVEVSSFQLETIKDFRPHIAALLNISEDHYERHANYDNYRAEKFKIFRNQSGDDWAVLHSDLAGAAFSGSGDSGRALIERIKSRLLFFGAETAEAAAGRDGVSVDLFGKKDIIVRSGEIPLKGAHNLDNIACAALVSRIMGVNNRLIREGIRNFRGLDHRFERIGDFDGVEFIDDSKATNIDATRRALESINKRVVLIAGGRDKGGDYLSVLPLVKEKVKILVLIGESREGIKGVFSHAVPVLAAESMAEAVNMASASAEEGEAVMLSPMCSSFDMFSGYKERGEVFQSEVRKLKG